MPIDSCPFQPPAAGELSAAQPPSSHDINQHAHRPDSSKAAKPEAGTSSCQWTVGQRVDVRGYGHAKVISTHSTDPAWKDRVQVQYMRDDSTYWCKPDSLRPVFPTQKRLCVCPTTSQYRVAMVHNASPQDVVLEVGCHEGRTTAMLHSRVKYVVGIDIAQQPVLDARARYPQCSFEVCDGFDVEKLRSLSCKQDGSFDKIFIDIGGIAPLPLVLSMVAKLQAEFKKATLIVKSVHLARFLGNAEVFAYDKHRHWAAAPPGTDEAIDIDVETGAADAVASE